MAVAPEGREPRALRRSGEREKPPVRDRAPRHRFVAEDDDVTDDFAQMFDKED